VRRWQLSEADRFFDIYRRDEIVRWLGADPMQDPKQAGAMIQRNLERQRAGSSLGSFTIVERSTCLPVGSIVLNELPDGDGEVEIGWQLHPDSWGKGYATEAAREVLTHSLANCLPEMWAVTFLDNDRSAAVCQRIGMRLLGVTTRWYHEPHLMFWAGAQRNQQPSFTPDGQRSE
jgi:RimJ/RimL family protein N-acetyltransferase